LAPSPCQARKANPNASSHCSAKATLAGGKAAKTWLCAVRQAAS